MNDPPAPDLGAIRGRLDARAATGRTIDDPDLRALLAAYDALAHDLAQAQFQAQANADTANINYRRIEELETENDAQAARLAALREWAVAERDEWSGRNADRYWQMTRVVNEIDGAAGAGEATDGD